MNKYLLTNLNIDIISDDIGGFLDKCNVESKDIMRIKLAVEETLLHYQEEFGEEQKVLIGCRKRLGRAHVEIRIPATRFNPMELEEDEITKKTRIIIIRLENGEVIGILVDEVKEVVTLQTSQIEKMAYDSKEDAKTNFISGVGKDKGELISLLDMNLVFAEKEKAN